MVRNNAQVAGQVARNTLMASLPPQVSEPLPLHFMLQPVDLVAFNPNKRVSKVRSSQH